MIVVFTVGETLNFEVFITVKWLSTPCTTEMLEREQIEGDFFMDQSSHQPQHAIVYQEH